MENKTKLVKKLKKINVVNHDINNAMTQCDCSTCSCVHDNTRSGTFSSVSNTNSKYAR